MANSEQRASMRQSFIEWMMHRLYRRLYGPIDSEPADLPAHVHLSESTNRWNKAAAGRLLHAEWPRRRPGGVEVIERWSADSPISSSDNEWNKIAVKKPN